MIHTYDDIISIENLCLAWEEFIIGKKKKRDVVEFGFRLMDHIVELHEELVNHRYRHGGYESFYINDPKPRHIHKADVRDRLLHHAVYRVLYPFFDGTFVSDSFSCRNEKGMHKALNRFRNFSYQVSWNHTHTCWVLKCDIQKFFASINHAILLSLLEKYIPDRNILWLLRNIIESFHTEGLTGVGLPLGNLTSQLFSNVYMNQFDQWVKHALKVKHYIRYADDFVFFSQEKDWLVRVIPRIQNFLQSRLVLSLHPKKVCLNTMASGIDFLGWVHFPDHRVLRNKTKKRMFRNMTRSVGEARLQSYFGLLSHGNTFKIKGRVAEDYWLRG